jgi:hypothetical protein
VTTFGLSEQEQQALARFVIGFGTEFVRTDYEISIAANGVRYNPDGSLGAISPVGNSGCSIGSLQWDFGQRPDIVPSFVSAYQFWASSTGNQVFSASEASAVVTALSSNGSALRATPGIGLSQDQLGLLDKFVASGGGADWVNLQLDARIIGNSTTPTVTYNGVSYGNTLVGAADKIEATLSGQLFSGASDNGKALGLAEVVGMKISNQSPGLFKQ